VNEFHAMMSCQQCWWTVADNLVVWLYTKQNSCFSIQQ